MNVPLQFFSTHWGQDNTNISVVLFCELTFIMCALTCCQKQMASSMFCCRHDLFVVAFAVFLLHFLV